MKAPRDARCDTPEARRESKDARAVMTAPSRTAGRAMLGPALVAVGPTAIARATIHRHSRSFALASRLLAPRERDQTAVVYTWCRRADDAIDTSAATTDTLARLARELHDAYAATARDPVLAAFGDVARARAIPIRYPTELLAGMAMDVHDVRYHTIDDTLLYAWRVAGVVGLMMAHVFGTSDDAALVPAAHLGIAMQLTNICRDVAEDWQRGRLYLPDDLLARHGAGGLAADLGHPLPPAARAPLAGAIAELLAIADHYYRSADRGIRALPWRAAIAVRAARRIYAAIGAQLARTGHDPLAGRAIVSTARKLAHVLTAVAAGTTAAAISAATASARLIASAHRRPRSAPAIPRRILGPADV
jgi:phytoene synthase